ncbi:MAG TPA: 4Fe-4S ferredoxin, partial [Lachnospiraceae bacterium]|nr:4Fe-4S ferredoxin [Lachnospiraceae bacterium]
MKFTTIVFSPTGGTQRVVDELVAEWGEPADKVDLTDAMIDFDAITLEKDDVAVIAVPSYGGRVPSLA